MQCPACKKEISNARILLKSVFSSFLYVCPFCKKNLKGSSEFHKALKFEVALGVFLGALLIAMDQYGRSGLEQLAAFFLPIGVYSICLSIYLVKNGSLLPYQKPDAEAAAQEQKKDRMKAAAILIISLLLVIGFFGFVKYTIGNTRPFNMARFETNIAEQSAEKLGETIEAIEVVVKSENMLANLVLEVFIYFNLLLILANVYILFTGIITPERLGSYCKAYRVIAFSNIGLAIFVVLLSWLLQSGELSSEVLAVLNVDKPLEELKKTALEGGKMIQSGRAILARRIAWTRLAGYLFIGLNFFGLILLGKEKKA